MDASFYVVTPFRVCEHCNTRGKEAFPYGVYDANGKYWDVLCNDCYDALGCSYPQDEQLCEICGMPKEWESCWNGCDDGYLSLHDEDPLLYDEDDMEACHICDGDGGWWVCPQASTHKEVNENS